MEDEIIDPILVCPYCGDTMVYPNENQMRFFNNELPKCCEKKMLVIDKNDLFKVAEGLGKLKAKIEEEIIRGIV